MSGTRLHVAHLHSEAQQIVVNHPGWVVVRIGELAELQPGYAFKSKWFEATGVRLLRGTNVVPGGTRWDDVVHLSDQRAADFGAFRLAAGDIVIAMDRPVISSGLKVVRLREDDLPALLLQRVGRFVVGPAVTTDFLYRFIQTQTFLAHVGVLATGTQLPHISKTDIESAPMPVPPLNEQRRIVDKVDALFAHSKKAKASLDRIPALLEKLKKSILAAAFKGDLTKDWREAHPDVEPADKLLDRIRTERRRRWEEAELAKMRAKGKLPKDDRWKQKYKEPEPIDTKGLPQLPTGWVWAPLEALTDGHRVIRYGILKPGPDVIGGVPYVKVKHIRGGRIHLDKLLRTTPEIHQKYVGAALVAGDILISIRGSWGRLAVVPDELVGGNITQDSARIAPLAEVRQDYLLQALSSPEAGRFFDSVAKGMAVRGVNIRDLRRTPVPLCPEEEQGVLASRVAESLSIVVGSAAGHRAGIRRLVKLDQAILAKAFRGELVPQDPNDEPASVLLERIRAEREAAGPTKKAPRGGRGRKKKAAPEPEPAAEPEPTPRSRPPAPPQTQPSLPFDEQFLDLGPREQAQALATTLFGAGPLPKGDAMRLAADGLRALGLSDHKRLRTGGKLHTALEKALTNGVRHGLLDRPARGKVRAIKTDAKTWSESDWALVAAAVPPNGDLDAWIREAATWAADNCGLEFTRLRTGGLIDRGLRAAAR